MNKKLFVVCIMVFLVLTELIIFSSENETAIKIAVASDGKTPESKVALKGARCRYLLFFDQKGELLKYVENPYGEQGRRAGVSLAMYVAEKKIKVFVSGMVGPNMQRVLDEQKITFVAFEGSVDAAVAFVLAKEKEIANRSHNKQNGSPIRSPYSSRNKSLLFNSNRPYSILCLATITQSDHLWLQIED